MMRMVRIFLGRCRWLLPLWAAFLALLVGLAAYELHVARADGEERLAEEARRIARRSGEILALPAWHMDEAAVRSIVMAEMEDERIYGMAVYDRQELLEGQRRDEHWEPVPWDDLVPDDTAEGVFALTMEDRPVGTVRVYLASRRLEEHLSALWRREALRVLVLAGVATLLLAWVVRGRMQAPGELNAAGAGENIPDASQPSAPGVWAWAADLPERLPGLAVHDAVRRLGGQVETYLALAELFRRLYAVAPKLLLRLVVAEDAAALSGLSRSLRRAASGLGAERLESALLSLEDALRERPAAVARRAEECAAALEEALKSAGALH